MTMIDFNARPQTRGSYSSKVRLDLLVDDNLIPLAQIGPERVVLAGPGDVRPGLAEIIMHVDGEPRRWLVEILPHPAGDRHLPMRHQK